MKADFPLTTNSLRLQDTSQRSSRQSLSQQQSDRPSFRSLHKCEYIRSTASTQRETNLLDSVSNQKPIDARRYEAFMSSLVYDFDDSVDGEGMEQYKFYDMYRGKSTDRTKRDAYGRSSTDSDRKSLNSHTWHKFARFPVKQVKTAELPPESRTLATETRFKKSEYVKNHFSPAKGTVLENFDRQAFRSQAKERETKSKYEYIDPTARFMGICYPGRCEQKQIYDVKLNCKVFADPYEDYMRFLQTKGDFHPHTRDTNYYKQLGLIRLGDACQKDKARSAAGSRRSSIVSDLKDGSSIVEDEVCATIDRISRLRRDWRLLVSECTSRIDLTAEQVLYQLLDNKNLSAIDRHEFVKLLRGFKIHAEPEQVDGAFKLIDLDKDERIDVLDLRRLLSLKSLSPSEIRFGPSQPRHSQGTALSSDFYVPFAHLLRCLLCIGENLRSVRLALNQLAADDRISTLADTKQRLIRYSHRHCVFDDDIDFIAKYVC